MFRHSLSDCRLCPRRCGANRASGAYGYCGSGNRLKIFSYGPHHGEEPPVSGTRGSGAVFFCRCTLRCIYCQNYRWSQAGEGKQYSTGELAGILRSLHGEGCHNWNLVSPTPWLHFIMEAIEQLKFDGISLPIVYNTSGFENTDTLAELAGRVDIYLADLRYADNETAAAASDAPEYVLTARRAITEMWRQAGALKLDGRGVAASGTICRLLILPGHAEETVASLRWLADAIGTEIAVSIMSQYAPVHKAAGMEPWGRRITRAEYDMVCAAVEDLGFKNGWIQEYGGRICESLAGFNFEPRMFSENMESEKRQ